MRSFSKDEVYRKVAVEVEVPHFLPAYATLIQSVVLQIVRL